MLYFLAFCGKNILNFKLKENVAPAKLTYSPL